MPAERLSMRKIREVLRLTHALGMSYRKVSEATGIGKTAVGEYVRRAEAAGISWPVPPGIDDAELERRLFPSSVMAGGASCHRLAGHPEGAEAARRDAVAAVAGVSRRAADGLRLQRFCELLQRLEEDGLGDDAADASGGRASCSSTGPATRCRCH